MLYIRKTRNKEIPPHLNHTEVISVLLSLSRHCATATPPLDICHDAIDLSGSHLIMVVAGVVVVAVLN